jgi:hypothetical protein
MYCRALYKCMYLYVPAIEYVAPKFFTVCPLDSLTFQEKGKHTN